MKKNLNLLSMTLLAVVLMLLTGCAENRLKQAVEKFDRQCPINMGEEFGSLASVTYDDGLVAMNYEMAETYVSVAEMKAQPEMMRRNILMNFSNSNDALKPFLDAIADANADLTVNMTGKKTGDLLTLKLTSEEIKKAMRSEAATPMQLMEAMVSMANNYMPKQIEEGITLMSMTIEDGVVYYNYLMDENLYSIDMLEIQKEAIKEENRAALSQLSPAEATDLKRVSAANYSLGYRYQGDTTGKSMEVIFSVDELNELFN